MLLYIPQHNQKEFCEIESTLSHELDFMREAQSTAKVRSTLIQIHTCIHTYLIFCIQHIYIYTYIHRSIIFVCIIKINFLYVYVYVCMYGLYECESLYYNTYRFRKSSLQ